LVFENIGRLPRASRSRYLNRASSAGIDCRSREGRLYRDITAELLAPYGGDAATGRVKLLVRTISRLTVELARIEALEACGSAGAIAALSEYADLASKLGTALRKLDGVLKDEPKQKRENGHQKYAARLQEAVTA
jgi:hypothetical protein